MRFVQKRTKSEVTEAHGFDWYKIVKVDGGHMLFETMAEYRTWKAQK